MHISEDCYFMLEVGGFFSGCSKLTIKATDDGYVRSRYSFSLGDSEDSAFAITEDDIKELDEMISRVGANQWFTHYNNYCVLDGTQWEMRIGNLGYSGSNLYPIGFFELCNYVAEKFDCPGLYWEDEEDDEDNYEYPSEFEAQFLPPLRPAISFLAEHHGSIVSKEEMKERIEEWNLIEEEALKEYEDDLIAFDHDLRIVIDQTPECSNYYDVLDEIGTGMDIDKIKGYDVGHSDEKTILALMTAVTRADHLSGRDGYFKEFAMDGVFARWLDRLSELVQRPPYC